MSQYVTVKVLVEGDITRNEWPTLEDEIGAALLAEGVTDPGHTFVTVEVTNVSDAN